jgi:hypothetical protein
VVNNNFFFKCKKNIENILNVFSLNSFGFSGNSRPQTMNLAAKLDIITLSLTAFPDLIALDLTAIADLRH